MNVKLNGEPHQLAAGASIPDLLAILGFAAGRGVAVAVNGEVVPRSEWRSFRVTDGMQIEVLKAVQGG
ncbi:MAG TPA: sulfur carrier protein ThiS [Actinomycetota bacterium]|nr:sulfur carrier protein ThiS [Actinomycetota bacterium]